MAVGTPERRPLSGDRGRASADIKTQINLPWKKAFEIAMNSLRIRFWRSVITASGIFLGIAFFSFTLTTMLVNPSAAGSPAYNRQLWLVIMALLVCLVGIMNSMLMSVAERFREIGTMKCLGALDKLIVRLFMLEALFMGIVASIAGWLLGFLFIVLVRWGMLGWARAAHPLTAVVILKLFGICVGVGAVLTMIAALLPALRAAQMPPASALRTEV